MSPAGRVNRYVILLWCILMVLLVHVPCGVFACPPGCTCTILKPRDGDADHDSPTPGRKVVCRGGSSITNLGQIRVDTIPEDTVYLDLNSNSISTIQNGSFLGLTSVKKLDLNNNQISQLEPGAFSGLDNLVRLDLSGNHIGSINASMLEGLPKLERLYLAANEIKGIPEGTFDVLPALKKLDFQSTYLVCDCHLAWVVRWQKTSKVRIKETTVCSYPKTHRGQALRGLKAEELNCDWTIELPLFELTPAKSQVVFQGDKLPFKCRASIVDPSTKMVWIREGHPVSHNRSMGIIIHIWFSPDHTVMIQSLVLEPLTVEDSGRWTCQVQTARGNVAKSVNIFVMSKDTLFCPSVWTRTNKGAYLWPKTVSGVRAELACESGKAAVYNGDSPARALYECSELGQWHGLDVTRCQYASEVTRVLEEYSKTVSENATRVVNQADNLRDYIIKTKTISDKMDVIYTAKIVDSLGKQVRENEQLGDIILHIVSLMMDVRADLLVEAQKEDNSCSRMVKVVEMLPKQLLWTKKSFNKFTANIAVEAHEVQQESFTGLTCAAYGKGQGQVNNAYLDKSFTCRSPENSTLPLPTWNGMVLEAAIHIPASIFKAVRCLYPVCSQSNAFTLQFIVYKNAKLFPVILGGSSSSGSSISSDRSEANIVPTSIISGKIGFQGIVQKVGGAVSPLPKTGVAVENTSSPIIIQLRSTQPGVNQRAVYWDYKANEGKGQWVQRGCSIVNTEGAVSTLHCNHLTHFGILQSPPPPPTAWQSWLEDSFNMSPAVYAGSAVLVICAMATVITYITSHRILKMPGKAKHAIANVSLCLLLLCVAYTLGIRTRRPIVACQILGIGIHYLSLCVLFWIAIISYIMLRKFTKVVHPPPPPQEPLEGPPPRNLAVTCYLIGWGIPMIICGISGAINWKNYMSHSDYCFLSFEASLLTFFVPVGLLILINIFFFLRICCLLQGPSVKYAEPIDEPETEEVQVNELNETLNDDGVMATGTTTLVTRDTTGSATTSHNAAQQLERASSTMDLEYRPLHQLYAVLLLLFLYLVTWTSGAFAVSLPFPDVIPHQSMIFNYLYGLSSAILGIYLLLYFCVGRKDGRVAWNHCFCCRNEAPYLNDSRSSRHSNLRHATRANGHVHSASSLDSSAHNSKSNSYTPALYGPKKKTSNVNLIPSLTATLSDPSVSSVDFPVFYNPRQNGVARKYWEKNRQHRLLSQLSREMNTDSGHSSHTEGLARGIGRRGDGHNHGSGSDGNPHLGNHAQMQLDVGKPCSVEQTQNMYNSLSRKHHPGGGCHSPILLPPPGLPLLLNPLDRSLISPPVGGHSPPQEVNLKLSPQPASRSRMLPHLEGSSSNFIPGTSNPSSIANYPVVPPYMLAPGYELGNNHMLPQSIPASCPHHPVNEYMQRNGSVPRLRDFDGQSSVSQEQRPQSPGSDSTPTHVEHYKPATNLLITLGPRVVSPDHCSTSAGIYFDNTPGGNRNRDKTNSLQRSANHPQGDSQTHEHDATSPVPLMPKCSRGSSPHAQPEFVCSSDTSFLTQLAQRIPRIPSPPPDSQCVPSHSDSSLGAQCLAVGNLGEDGKDSARSSKSSGMSATTKQSKRNIPLPPRTACDKPRRRPKSGDSSESRRQARNHNRNSRGSNSSHGSSREPKMWDEEMNSLTKKNDAKAPTYSYFNHNYQEKVLQKLLRTNSQSGGNIDDSGILPRSVSAYDQVLSTEGDTLVESTTSSSCSDTDSEDVWVLQKPRHKKKSNKETSV